MNRAKLKPLMTELYNRGFDSAAQETYWRDSRHESSIEADILAVFDAQETKAAKVVTELNAMILREAQGQDISLRDVVNFVERELGVK